MATWTGFYRVPPGTLRGLRYGSAHLAHLYIGGITSGGSTLITLPAGTPSHLTGVVGWDDFAGMLTVPGQRVLLRALTEPHAFGDALVTNAAWFAPGQVKTAAARLALLPAVNPLGLAGAQLKAANALRTKVQRFWSKAAENKQGIIATS